MLFLRQSFSPKIVFFVPIFSRQKYCFRANFFRQKYCFRANFFPAKNIVFHVNISRQKMFFFRAKKFQFLLDTNLFEFSAATFCRSNSSTCEFFGLPFPSDFCFSRYTWFLFISSIFFLVSAILEQQKILQSMDTRNPYSRGRISTVDLLVLTSLDQLLLYWKYYLPFLKNKLS